MERQNSAFYVSLLILLFAGAIQVNAGVDGGFLGKNSVEARRTLKERVDAQEPTLIWARQLSALVFLERLTGNEAHARRVWEKCDGTCRKLLPQEERAALERWEKQEYIKQKAQKSHSMSD